MRFLPLLLGFVLTSISLAADQSEYLPLSEGCEWTMDAVLISPQGEKSTATGRRKVAATEQRGGKTFHRTRSWVEGGPFPMEYSKLTRKDDTGFYSLDPKDADAKEQTEVLLPLEVGKSWQRVGGADLGQRYCHWRGNLDHQWDDL